MKPQEYIEAIADGRMDENLKAVYVLDSAVEAQKERYINTIREFINIFGEDRDIIITSAPEERRYAEIIPIIIMVRLWLHQLILMRLLFVLPV